MTIYEKAFTDIIENSVVPILVPLGFENHNLDFFRNINDISQVFKIRRRDDIKDYLSFSFHFGFHNLSLTKKILGIDKINYPIFKLCFIGFTYGPIEYIPTSSLFEIIERFREYLITDVNPLFETYDSFENLKIFVSKNENAFLGHPYTKAVYLLTIEEKEKGIAELKSLYHKYAIPEKQESLKQIKDFEELYGAEISTNKNNSDQYIKCMWEHHKITKDYPNYFYVYEIERIAKLYGIEL